MYGWYKSESNGRPDTVNTTMSKKWVYIRKNIVEETRELENENETYTVYVYDECKIPKDIYVVFENQMVSDVRLAEVEEAITEIVGGGL